MNGYSIAAAAQQDLIAIVAYYNNTTGDIELSDRFINCTEATFGKLAKMPGKGQPRHFRRSILKGLRSWRIDDFPTYLIFYRENSDRIEIVRVLHGARNLEQELSENAIS